MCVYATHIYTFRVLGECVMDLFGLPLSLLMGFVCSLSRLFAFANVSSKQNRVE